VILRGLSISCVTCICSSSQLIPLQVFILFLADTVNSVFDVVALYGTLIKHFGMFLIKTCQLRHADQPSQVILKACNLPTGVCSIYIIIHTMELTLPIVYTTGLILSIASCFFLTIVVIQNPRRRSDYIFYRMAAPIR
jgi:hypothetical protein